MEEKNKKNKLNTQNKLVILLVLIIVFVSISSFLLTSLMFNENGDIDNIINNVAKNSYKGYDLEQARINALNGLLQGQDRYSHISKENRFAEGLKKFNFDFKYDEKIKNRIIITNSIKTDLNTKLYPNDLVYGVKLNEDIYLFENYKDFSEATFIKIIKKEIKPKSNNFELLIERKSFNSNELVKVKAEVLLLDIYDKNIKTNLIEKGNKVYLYIKFPNFISNTLVTQVKDKLIEFSKIQKEKELIFDLTNNGGGSVLIAQELLSLFIDNKNDILFRLGIYNNNTIVDYNDYHDLKQENIDTNYNINIIVNENTASASELFTTVLTSFRKNVKVYGKKTYGKNVFQTTEIVGLYGKNYYLTKTLGYWLYFDKRQNNFRILDNKDNPIKVIEKDFSLYSMDIDFSFEKDILLDQVDNNLKIFQELSNQIYKKDLRTDGYFDLKTQEFIKEFQQNNNLNVTSTLNFETFITFYDKIKLYKENINNYKLLNDIILESNK